MVLVFKLCIDTFVPCQALSEVRKDINANRDIIFPRKCVLSFLVVNHTLISSINPQSVKGENIFLRKLQSLLYYFLVPCLYEVTKLSATLENMWSMENMENMTTNERKIWRITTS